MSISFDGLTSQQLAELEAERDHLLVRVEQLGRLAREHAVDQARCEGRVEGLEREAIELRAERDREANSVARWTSMETLRAQGLEERVAELVQKRDALLEAAREFAEMVLACDNYGCERGPSRCLHADAAKHLSVLESWEKA